MDLVIRADASPQIGIGHIMRCLALAQIWSEEVGQVTFITNLGAEVLADRILTVGMHINYLPSSVSTGSKEDAEYTVAKFEDLHADRIVLDSYMFGDNYQLWIKEASIKFLIMDDYGHANHYYADFVLNQNVYANENHYLHRESDTKLLLGCKYALLRQEFVYWQDWQRDIPEVAQKILITFGGADLQNAALKVMQALAHINISDLEVVVVVGGSYPHYETLIDIAQTIEVKTTLKRNVKNMAELMAWADIAITAGGSTCWDLAFMGLPSLIMILANNQKAVAEKLDSLGAAINLGWYSEVETNQISKALEHLLISREQRQLISLNARNLVDGDGSKRVTMFLQANQLRLRAARESDSQLLWEWVNDPAVRRSAFSSTWIPWEEHLEWFLYKLHDHHCQIYIALDPQDTPIGQVRFDLQENQEAEIDIHIEKKKRGLGYSKDLITISIRKIFNSTSIQLINAYIKPDNLASIQAFKKSHFCQQRNKIVNGRLSCHYAIKRKIHQEDIA